MEMSLFVLLLSYFICTSLILVEAQNRPSTTTSTNTPEVIPIPTSCSTFYRNTRRSGPSVSGQFQIPVDSQYPKFQLQVKLSRQVHSMTFRQMKAKDLSGHREFSIGTLEPENGIVTFSSTTRLGRSFLSFGRVPKVTRIVYNGKTLCADGESPVNNGVRFDNNAAAVIEAPIKKTSKFTKVQSLKAKERWNISTEIEDDEDEEIKDD